LIRERTNAGLASARGRGRMGGRPKVITNKRIRIAKTMLADPKTTIKEVCETLQVSKTTLYRYLK
jgi:DNA invertase Pin-like site-specific DNA recombinase